MTDAHVDDLLDRAIAALNRGDVDRARDLAGQVLATEAGNLDAGDLLVASRPAGGEIRRLTVLFCDLVGSTELSARLEPETYHSILQRYQGRCRRVVEERFEGSIVSQRGDGILAAFGTPRPHEDDVDRAVLAGLDLLAEVRALDEETRREHGESVSVRVAVHKGVVFIDKDAGDLFGFAVNVAARLEGLAEPGTVIISDEISRVIEDRFELLHHDPRAVKGVDVELATATVLGRNNNRGRGKASELVGREAEQRVLLEAWTQASEGCRAPRSCVAIVGEPGIGKTRLALEICDRARSEGGDVVELAGSPRHRAHGLWPVRDLVERRAAIDPGVDGPGRIALLRAYAADAGLGPDVVPVLATLLGLDPETGYEPVQADARKLREQIMEVAGRFLLHCCAERPTVLLCDDAQWLDEETRQLLAEVVRSPLTSALVLITSREESAVPRGDGTTVLSLDALEPTARMELLRAIAGDAVPPPVLVELAARSDGVPLYLEELVRTELQASFEPGRAPGAATSGSAGIPDVLYEPLVARLYVSDHGASVAAAVATIGREAEHDLLIRVAELEPAELTAAVDDLLGAMILEQVEAGPRVRFRHELVREVAYELQPPSRRRELHGRVGDALVAGSVRGVDVDWGVVGAHYEEAGRAADAATAFERASAGARRRGALAEAQSWLTRAIDAVADGPEALRELEAQIRLLRGFLSVSLEGNASASAGADYERCLELLVGAGEDNETLVSTLRALWPYYCSRGDLDRGEELLRVLSQTPKTLDRSRRFLSAAGRSLIEMYRGQFPAALAAAEEAVVWASSFEAVAEYTRDWFVPLDPAVMAYTYLSAIRLTVGDAQTACDQMIEARELAAALPFPQGPFSLAGHLSFEVWIHAELGDLDAATSSVDEMAVVAEQHGFDQWSIVAMTQRELLAGLRTARSAEPDVDALAGHASTIGGHLMMWKMTDTWVFVPYYTTMQGFFYSKAGNTEAAEAIFAESLAIAARTGMRFYDAETLRHLAAVRSSPITTEAGLIEAFELAEEQGSPLFQLRAARDLFDLTGDRERLRAVADGFDAAVSFGELDAARKALNDP